MRACPLSSSSFCPQTHMHIIILTFSHTITQPNISNNSKTFKPKKNIPEGTNQYALKKYAEATLGSGNLRVAVQLPPGEDLNEWLAVNGKSRKVYGSERMEWFSNGQRNKRKKTIGADKNRKETKCRKARSRGIQEQTVTSMYRAQSEEFFYCLYFPCGSRGLL